MVEDPARRQVFIKSALRFLRQYNFDGIDLDWEYPTLRAGGRPQDKDNYATFIEEMRQAFESESQKTGKERLLISMAVPASLEYAGQGYAIDRLDGRSTSSTFSPMTTTLLTSPQLTITRPCTDRTSGPITTSERI